MERLTREPVLVLDVLKAAIACAVVFGLDLPPEADVTIIALVTAVLALLQRSKVTPV